MLIRYVCTATIWMWWRRNKQTNNYSMKETKKEREKQKSTKPKIFCLQYMSSAWTNIHTTVYLHFYLECDHSTSISVQSYHAHSVVRSNLKNKWTKKWVNENPTRRETKKQRKKETKKENKQTNNKTPNQSSLKNPFPLRIYTFVSEGYYSQPPSYSYTALFHLTLLIITCVKYELQ